MIKFEKLYVLTAKNFPHFNVHQIMKIFLILYSIYEVLMDQIKFVFYINYFINYNQFN